MVVDFVNIKTQAVVLSVTADNNTPLFNDVIVFNGVSYRVAQRAFVITTPKIVSIGKKTTAADVSLQIGISEIGKV
jgi:hypothetical protein